ncbi:hypothetical protein LCGC14_2446290, partial [marine sediment metagenome]
VRELWLGASTSPNHWVDIEPALEQKIAALRHHESALSLQPPDDRKTQADLLFKRGMALRSLGRWEEALGDWREALAAYEERGDAEAVGRIAVDITQQLLWGAHFVEALETSRRGLIALGERTTADRCRLHASGGATLSLAGSYAAGDGMITQALAIAHELGDEGLKAQVLTARTTVHWAYRQVREAVGPGLTAAELLRAEGDLWDLATLLGFVEQCLTYMGRLDEVAAICEELEPLANRLGHMGGLLIVCRDREVRELLAGDLDKHEEIANSDLDLCRSADLPWISRAYTALGFNHFCRGRWEEALESFQEAVRLEPPGFWAGTDWSCLFLAKAYMGDRKAFLAMLEQRRNSLPRPGQPSTLGAQAVLIAAIEGLAVLGEGEEAGKLYPPVLDQIERGVVTPPPLFVLCQTVAGIAAAAGGRWDKAEEHYQEALRQAHELPHKIAQPEVRRWYARMLIDRDAPGDRDKARELLTEAIAMYREIGMPKHVGMAQALPGEATL